VILSLFPRRKYKQIFIFLSLRVLTIKKIE
jgi:hypothetical protein